MKPSDLDDLEQLARAALVPEDVLQGARTIPAALGTPIPGSVERLELPVKVLALVDELRQLFAPAEGIDVGAILERAERMRPEAKGAAFDDLRWATETIPALAGAVLEARGWVRRLTASERVLTCAFCGEAYPPGTPETNHEALTAHVKVCPAHPMREAEKALAEAQGHLACEKEAHGAARRALEHRGDELRAADADRRAMRAEVERQRALLNDPPPVEGWADGSHRRTFFSDDPAEPLFWIRVEVDHDGLWTIAEEDISSRSPTAQPTNCRGAVDATLHQARWLHGALGELLAEREGGGPLVTGYTREQLARAIDDAHAKLHEAEKSGLPKDTGAGGIPAFPFERVQEAHEALHRAGAGLPRVGCATPDPEAQAVVRELLAGKDHLLPCKHTVGDLILTGPEGRTVTKCGACVEALRAKGGGNAER